MRFFERQRVDELGDLSVAFELVCFALGALSGLDLVLTVAYSAAAREWMWNTLFAAAWLALTPSCALLAARRLRAAFPLFIAGTAGLGIGQIYYIGLSCVHVSRGGAPLPGLVGVVIFLWIFRFVPVIGADYFAISALVLRGGARRVVREAEEAEQQDPCSVHMPYIPPQLSSQSVAGDLQDS
eukprot:m51a1_g10077 hypothetical protein (183) ;mRNA; f:41104-41985